MFKQKTLTFVGVFLSLLISAAPAFAHATVKPNTAGVGAFTDFTLGVPSEKPIATTAVKLTVPAGLNHVTPVVKSGWTISIKRSPDPSGKKDDEGNPATIVSEISWTGGQVPAEQKDFFMFSAQVPTQETELHWMVDQTYADGTVVSWSKAAHEQPKDEKGNSDFTQFGPYSITKVVNDLKASPPASSNPEASTTMVQGISELNLPLLLGALGTILGTVAIGMNWRKK